MRPLTAWLPAPQSRVSGKGPASHLPGCAVASPRGAHGAPRMGTAHGATRMGRRATAVSGPRAELSGNRCMIGVGGVGGVGGACGWLPAGSRRQLQCGCSAVTLVSDRGKGITAMPAVRVGCLRVAVVPSDPPASADWGRRCEWWSVRASRPASAWRPRARGGAGGTRGRARRRFGWRTLAGV